ncbi:DNA topoisomerase IV subunit A [Dermacoccus sp. 147Ba]|uniref:DNA gyrase/topoisomerase IV subunit A n=1 Tax=Dermacoccus sp. 147Ba TaxID=2510111 RepID=UPI00101CFFCE|nr:DNA topoisomerase IV subunit A [Dermacoccus sp. 147Ba]RYI24560.1 DNA topoisomerase IV subunit A [Dermacoccus sp. 147Ba]
MARSKKPEVLDDDFVENIIDIDVEEEMRSAFLEYSYSVIYSRALPDARDGLKPVQRRILFSMDELGLMPTKNHVKSSRVVGEVMGKYHPHGDSAIYDTLVRMAQDFTMRLPLVDGHGNFGSLDQGPAASRYTEARLAPAALTLTESLDENTVDFVPNYDDSLQQPSVLPAAFPNLLVNGASGIAVGMATNMPPHNLGEVVQAAVHLIKNPDCSLDDLMRFVPGPDLPMGGRIVGLEGVRDAYLSGRGSFRTRATCSIENVTPRKKGIVVTELPYMVGPEKVIDRMRDLVSSKKLQGISDVKDLSDRHHGLRLVIELKNGFNPDAVLEQLYKLTPMEESFGINNVALVDGQPRTLGLKDLLRVYTDFRVDVVRRRTAYRLGKKEDRLHLVDGLLIAILDIDEVIQIIRSSDDSGIARERLMKVFDLSEAQATYILDLQLRRLTKFSRLELEKEAEELRKEIEKLRAILADVKLLHKVVCDELLAIAKEHGTPRRTVLLEASGETKTAKSATPLEIADDPCWVLLSSTGLVARTTNADPLGTDGNRRKHDAIVAAARTSARGEFGVVTSTGRLFCVSALELPHLVDTHEAPVLDGGAPLAAFVDLAPGEKVLTVTSLRTDSPGLALGTAAGVVKRVNPDYANKPIMEVITLKGDDVVVGAVELQTGTEELVFVTNEGQLLHFNADGVRPQGRTGGGVAGIKLGKGAHVIHFGSVSHDGIVVTGAGHPSSPDGEITSLKVAPFAEFPAKGRATAGVRAHRFLRGENHLTFAWVGSAPARAADATGKVITLPPADGKRDGSGDTAPGQIAAIGTTAPYTDVPADASASEVAEQTPVSAAEESAERTLSLFDGDDA